MKRNPYSDLGLIVAVAAFIIMVLKSLIFDFSWGAIAWILITMGYFVLSYRYDSYSRIIRRATTFYLLLSAVVLVSVVLFDKNARPKIHAFEGAASDSIEEEEIFVADDEEYYAPAPVDTLDADSLVGEQAVNDDNPTVEGSDSLSI